MPHDDNRSPASRVDRLSSVTKRTFEHRPEGPVSSPFWAWWERLAVCREDVPGAVGVTLALYGRSARRTS